MPSCVKNIPTKNYQHLVIGFQVTVKNVGDGIYMVILSVCLSCLSRPGTFPRPGETETSDFHHMIA